LFKREAEIKSVGFQESIRTNGNNSASDPKEIIELPSLHSSKRKVQKRNYKLNSKT
jgi:hypothetical protein